jgi:hypothetical protein
VQAQIFYSKLSNSGMGGENCEHKIRNFLLSSAEDIKQEIFLKCLSFLMKTYFFNLISDLYTFKSEFLA